MTALFIAAGVLAAGAGAADPAPSHQGLVFSRLSAIPLVKPADTRRSGATRASWQPAATARDSLKNGAIIGAIVGATAALVVTAAACGLDEATGGDTDCGGELAVAAAAGAGLGGAIGLGIDAALSRGPHAAAGSQMSLRVRLRF